MSITTQYKKLSEVEHVLLRPGRYIGTINTQNIDTFYFDDEGEVHWKTLNYNPGFLKIFDEIISNSADFSKTKEGKHVNKIEVNISTLTGEISVYDNGGIPVIKHPEYDQYIPDMIFGELRSGSNFDDDDDSVGTGQNGEGATLTSIFSTRFEVDTADGKHRFKKVYLNNSRDREDEEVTKSRLKHTRITYIPDYERFGCSITGETDDYLMLVRRVHEIAATNTHLKVTLNGKEIKYKNFSEFAKKLDSSEEKAAISFGHDRFEVTVFPSEDGFQHISYINSTCVHKGGTQIPYVMNQIVGAVREHVQRRTKQDVKPSDIQNHFHLVINAQLNNPRYNSQTKEQLETLPSQYGTSLSIDDKVMRRIINSPIVASIIEWAENRALLKELQEQRRKNKENARANLRDIEKYEPATQKTKRNECVLFLCEGDSAASPLRSARDPKTQGIFALKGKPINVRGRKIRDLVKNAELNNIMRILGLGFGEKPDPKELRYGKIVIATDMDLDGHHLSGLLINMFYTLWPELLESGYIVKLNTPIVRIKQGKKEIDFMSLKEFEEWEKNNTQRYQAEYLKGLGSNDTRHFKKYMHQEKYFLPISIEDESDIRALDIAFDKTGADVRKEFLYGDV